MSGIDQTFNRVKTFAERSKGNKSFAFKNLDLMKDSELIGANFSVNTLKEKLERFYYAYNKSLVVEDGMNFSECDSQEDEDDELISRRTGKQNWSLLQRFICQTNNQRFEDNLENISKEIRCPTPTYIKKKKIYRGRRARQTNVFNPQRNRNGPVVIPSSELKLQKEINSKLLSPVKENSDMLATSKTIPCEIENDIKENDEPNLTPSSEESSTQNEKEKDTISVSFDQIFGAFCKRYSKKKNITKECRSSRNCIINREMCHTLEPVKISTHHDDEAIRVCTKPFPIDSGLFKFRFSQRMDSELRNSFESSPTSFCGRNQLMNDKFRKSYKQAESFDLYHHNASTKYSSIAEDLLNEPKTPTNGSEISSLFKTLVHFPRPLPKTKILDHSYIPKPKSNENETRLAHKKNGKTKIHLKDINKKKNIENLKMKPQKRKNSMRANSIAPHNFKF